MGLNRVLLLSICVFFVTGCSGTVVTKRAYDKGYKRGLAQKVDDAVEEIKKQGNSPYVNWYAPIVQEVVVPAHINNGVFIPEHKELVIINPGSWKANSGYEIKNQIKNGDAVDYQKINLETLEAIEDENVRQGKENIGKNQYGENKSKEKLGNKIQQFLAKWNPNRS